MREKINTTETRRHGVLSLCLRVSVSLFWIPFHLQAQSTILIQSFTTNDSVLLRWVPKGVSTWKAGAQKGYTIERWTNEQYFDTPGLKGELLATVVPLAQKDTTWKKLMRAYPANALVFEALYGAPKKGTEEQMQFGLALKAADLSVATAKAEGLYFCDRTAQSGKSYVYRIAVAGTTNSGLVFTDGKISVLPVPSKPSGEFKNKTATISFEAASTRASFAGYIIERSDDSLHFSRVNATLLVFAVSNYEKDKSMLVYRDTLPQNGKAYWYRVRGYSFFGIDGPPSVAVKGKGKQEWLATPVIDTLFSRDNKSVSLQWHLPDSVADRQVKRFCLFRSQKPNAEYALVKNYAATSRSCIDDQPAFANYYLLGAISVDNDTAFSYPYFFQLIDDVPPPVPQNITAVIDTNGIVQLSWKNVIANDLKGYRVFRCNDLREEWIEVSDSVLRETVFTDTVTLQTLTRQVYYSVKSVDKLYNNSALSSPCRVRRPDKIPPVPPLVRSISHSDSTIALAWINSSSEDVSCVELKRNDGVVLGSWRGNDTLSHFSDQLLVPGQTYSYSLTVTDSSGNESRCNFPAIVFLPQVYPALKNFTAVPDFEKREIRLSWQATANVDRYVIYKAKKGEPMRSWKTVNAATISFIDKEAYPGNVYEYRVKAILKNGSETKLVSASVVF